MSYPQNNGITWQNLEDANKARLPEFRNKHGQPAHSELDGSDWSLSDWTVAVTGELGEFANLLKKYIRGDIAEEVFRRDGGFELADVVIYLSILAFRAGIDLDEVVREKFNIVSGRVGSRVFIGDDWEYHLKAE